ncbi:hypothetical protein AGOR_G00096030 [Albula goreensis]|uniref:Fibronectin type-III domain-containing protein n=1 Tax=Albula goreensis TaxID=1534307 RepID=A0A8T3DKG7_9TELE|nr:hypothetical protein AGOR_G00096030 [Albula goreensis]
MKVASSLVSAFFLIIVFHGVHTLVPAPFNVTVSCHNFETIVHWNYSKNSLQPTFEVKILRDIKSSPSVPKKSFLTKLHYLNISTAVKDISETYYVNVTALGRSENSTPGSSQQFSYHESLPAEVRCTLDFPPVKLSVKNGKITIAFTHPSQVYKNTSKEFVACENFKYNIFLNDMMEEEFCNTDECKITRPAPKVNEKYCVNLTGSFCNTNMKNSGEQCQYEESQSGWEYFILIFVAILMVTFVGMIIGFIVFKRKTEAMPQLPKSLKHLGFQKYPEKNKVPEVYEKVQDVQIVWPLVNSSPPLHNPKEMDLGDSPESPQEGSRFPIGHVGEWRSNQEAISSRGSCHLVTSNQSNQWEPEGEDPGDNSGSSLFSGINSSGYDRPQILVEMNVEISPGETVHAYGPRN